MKKKHNNHWSFMAMSINMNEWSMREKGLFGFMAVSWKNQLKPKKNGCLSVKHRLLLMLDRWQHVGRASIFCFYESKCYLRFFPWHMVCHISPTVLSIFIVEKTKKKSLTSYHIIDLSFNFQSHLYFFWDTSKVPASHT